MLSPLKKYKLKLTRFVVFGWFLGDGEEIGIKMGIIRSEEWKEEEKRGGHFVGRVKDSC